MRDKDILVVTSQGLAAPSLAVLGPKGVALLLPACPAPFRSHGFAGAVLPASQSFPMESFQGKSTSYS